MLLALERSGRVASAALFAPDGVPVASVARPGAGEGDAFPLVRDLLAEAGVSPGALTAFAVGVGPGSFTGIRSALALAQGLAIADGLPVRGVSTPGALAFRLRRERPDLPPVRVFGDARRGHVWCFDEPADFASLRHDASDLRLLSRDGSDPALEPFASAAGPACGRALFSADPERLGPDFEALGVSAEPAVATASDVAALFFAGFSGAPDPVYLHPAVAGTPGRQGGN